MEENRVATRLSDIIHNARKMYGACIEGSDCRTLTDAILQSPDLRVTLVEPPKPRYEVEHFLSGGKMHWRVNEILATKPYKSITEAGYFGVESDMPHYVGRAEKAAKEYCDWLNSKEPK